jgi:hypothetical protein
MNIDKRKLLLGGGIVGIIGLTALIIRHLTKNYASITTAINSVMGNYFTINELCASTIAKEQGIDNTPNATVKANLTALINNLLNPIRERYGKPIRVSSGYRCEALNKYIHGVDNSQHKKGQAADLLPTTGGSLADIFRAAIAVGNFDQLILEKPNGTMWVHVSYSPNPRHQILYYDGKVHNGTKYPDISSNWERFL